MASPKYIPSPTAEAYRSSRADGYASVWTQGRWDKWELALKQASMELKLLLDRADTRSSSALAEYRSQVQLYRDAVDDLQQERMGIIKEMDAIRRGELTARDAARSRSEEARQAWLRQEERLVRGGSTRSGRSASEETAYRFQEILKDYPEGELIDTELRRLRESARNAPPGQFLMGVEQALTGQLSQDNPLARLAMGDKNVVMQYALELEADRIAAANGTDMAGAQAEVLGNLAATATGPSILRRLQAAQSELDPGGGPTTPKERVPFPGSGGGVTDRDPLLIDLENRLKEVDARRAQLVAPGDPPDAEAARLAALRSGSTDLIGRAREIYRDKFGTFGPRARKLDRSIDNTKRIFDAFIAATMRQLPDEPERARQLGIARAVAYLKGGEVMPVPRAPAPSGGEQEGGPPAAGGSASMRSPTATLDPETLARLERMGASAQEMLDFWARDDAPRLQEAGVDREAIRAQAQRYGLPAGFGVEDLDTSALTPRVAPLNGSDQIRPGLPNAGRMDLPEFWARDAAPRVQDGITQKYLRAGAAAARYAQEAAKDKTKMPPVVEPDSAAEERKEEIRPGLPSTGPMDLPEPDVMEFDEVEMEMPAPKPRPRKSPVGRRNSLVAEAAMSAGKTYTGRDGAPKRDKIERVASNSPLGQTVRKLYQHESGKGTALRDMVTEVRRAFTDEAEQRKAVELLMGLHLLKAEEI